MMQKRIQNEQGVIEAVLILLVVLALLGVGAYFFITNMLDEDTPTAQETTEQTEEADEAGDEQEPSPEMVDREIFTQLNRIMTALESYAANHNGHYPDPENSRELATAMEYPSIADMKHPVTDKPYTLDDSLEGHADYHYVTYRYGSCNEDGSIEPSDSIRRIAVQDELHDGELACVDNS